MASNSAVFAPSPARLISPVGGAGFSRESGVEVDAFAVAGRLARPATGADGLAATSEGLGRATGAVVVVETTGFRVADVDGAFDATGGLLVDAASDIRGAFAFPVSSSFSLCFG